MKILFVSHRLPYAPNRGDRVRAFHILKEMSRWAEVDIASLAHDDDEAARGPELKALGRRVAIARVPRVGNLIKAAFALPTSRPTTHSLLDAPELSRAVDSLIGERRPDLVFCYCTGIAPIIFRPSVAGIPVVLDMVDVDSEKWASLSETAAPPRSWIYAREARLLRVFEAEAMRRSTATLVVNDREGDDLRALLPGARILVVHNGVDVDSLKPTSGPAPEPVVVFCGVMNYEPNVEGVHWLAREVWPAVLRSCPGALLKIVGAQPSRSVLALDNPANRISVTGSVPDVRPYLWGAAVSVAPLQTSRGVQNKVLEAVAAGLPAVVTPTVMNGLPAAIKPACTVAETPALFAEAVIRWLEKPAAERRALAETADVHSLSWSRQLSSLQGILGEAAGRPQNSV